MGGEQEKVAKIHSYLDSEYQRIKGLLDKELPEKVVVIADIGLWDGRRNAYKEYDNNLSSCLNFFGDCYLAEFFLKDEDVMSKQSHHDGTHYAVYRVYKKGRADEGHNAIHARIMKGEYPEEEIEKYTKPLGKKVRKALGMK